MLLGLVTVRTDLVAGVRYYPSNGQPGDYGEYFTIERNQQLARTALADLRTRLLGSARGTQRRWRDEQRLPHEPDGLRGPADDSHVRATYVSPVVTETLLVHHAGRRERLRLGAVQPQLSVTPSTTQRDKPDALAIDVHVPQDQKPVSTSRSSQLREAKVKLPEGLYAEPRGRQRPQGVH